MEGQPSLADHPSRPKDPAASPSEFSNLGLANSTTDGGEVDVKDQRTDAESILEVDSDLDADFAIDEMSFVSSTTAARSSLHKSVEENGRTYHMFESGKYPVPNDQVEQNRLDVQHTLFRLTTHGKLHLAPIDPKNIHRVLDIGTGTGAWAIDYATENPSSHVLGIDLSAIQPELTPPNCEFEVFDAEDDWKFSTKFDFITGRALAACFADKKSIFQKAFDNLNPGGWIELQDIVVPMHFIGPVPGPCYLKQWNDICILGAERAGRPWNNVKNYKQFFEEVGFVDVQEKSFYWPTNPWCKDKHHKMLSKWFQHEFVDLKGLEGTTMRLLTGQLGWTAEDVREFVGKVQGDFRDRNVHAYLEIMFVWGRKPGGATSETRRA